MSSVLVVENNRMIRAMYSIGLTSFDYDVREAQSITEAKAQLENGYIPSIVLLDLQLDDGSGLDLITYIRHELNRPDVRIIVVTGMSIPHEDVIEHGADMVLCKPIELLDLLQQIHAYSV
jgi:DNA-binding response OmpR family regulator